MDENNIPKPIRICQVEGCKLFSRRRDFCPKHYYKAKKDGQLGLGICPIEGCNLPVFSNKLCIRHNYQMKTRGYTYRSSREPNYFEKTADGYLVHLYNRREV